MMITKADLQAQIEDYRKRIDAADEEIRNLKIYLHSDKFHGNEHPSSPFPYVHVTDALSRLQNIHDALFSLNGYGE